MKIKWLIQDTGIIMQNLESNFEALRRLNYNYSNFGLIIGEKNITNLENILENPDEKFVMRGGTKVLTLLNSIHSLEEVNPFLTPEQLTFNQQYIQNLKNAVFYNEETFDQANYSQLDLPLINKEATFYSIKDNLNMRFDREVFIKPSKDLKAFTAGIMPKGVTIEEYITNQSHQKTYIDEQALIAPCKVITSEYRFFVVEEEVITGSMYRLGDKVITSPYIPENMMTAAKEYAKLYQPHDVFTMDLFETPDGIFIGEYNCWNASGSYQTDLMKMFHTVQEYLEQPKNKHKLQF